MKRNLRYITAGTLSIVALSVIAMGPLARGAYAQENKRDVTIERAREVTVEEGTVIPVRIDEEISSRTSHRGDTFSATIRADRKGYRRFPVGSRITGVVRMARSQEGSEPGVIDLDFRHLRLPDGGLYPLSGSLIGLDNKSVETDDNGRLFAKERKRNNRLTYVGYGAGAGLILGVLTNRGRINFGDILLGGGLGYLAGALEKSKSEPRDVILKPGTEMGVRLDRTLTFTGEPLAYSYRVPDTEEDNRGPEFMRSGNSVFMGGDDEDIRVLVDDESVSFDANAAPMLSMGSVMLPANPVLNAAHVAFDYDRWHRVLTAHGDKTIRMAVGSRVAIVNGRRSIRLEAPARRIHNTFYVPLRFFEIATGRNLTWDADGRTVTMSSP